MPRLTRSNSTKSKSKEFGEPHNEKTWREKRMNRKSSRDRKHKADRNHARSSITSKLRHQYDWQTHVLAEKNEWDDDRDDLRDYMSSRRSDEIFLSPKYDEWGWRIETAPEKAIKLAHERQSADAFVSLIRDVLGGGAFHGQEFHYTRRALETDCQQDMTFGEFRIVLPDTTPRSSREVWITLRNQGWRRNSNHRRQRKNSRIPYQSIRLFRSGSKSLGSRTLTEFLDAVLNEIVADVFELSLPTTLVAIISSFCNTSTSEFKFLAKCALTIGGGYCNWYPREEPLCRYVCDFLGCCCQFCWKCHGDHQISMKVSARVGFDNKYEWRWMSHDWKKMAVYAFGRSLLCSSFRSYQEERGRHVQTIIRAAKMAAASWDQSALHQRRRFEAMFRGNRSERRRFISRQ